MFSDAASTRPKQGKPSSRGTPYLLAHRNSLAFRIRIPADLQLCLGKKEYRRSIGRCYAPEAKLRALRLATAAFEVFSFVRETVQGRSLALTGKPGAGKENGQSGYTPYHQHQEKTPVRQGHSDDHSGYANELQDRLLSSLTDDEIRSIAEAWLLNALKGSNLFTLQTIHQQALGADTSMGDELFFPGTPKNLSAAEVEDRAQNESERCRNIQAVYQKELKGRKVSESTAQMTDRALAVHGVATDPETESRAAVLAIPPRSSVPYLKACQELLKSRVSFYGIMEQNNQGDYAAHDSTIERLEAKQKARRIKVTKTEPTQPIDQSPSSGLTLSRALALFFEEMEREGRWTERTLIKERDKFTLFQAIISPDGSLPVASIGADYMRRYKKVLFGMPKNRTKSPKYKDFPLAELIQKAEAGTIPETDRIASRTIENHAIQIAVFINWAARNEYHSNPKITELLHVAKTKQDHENRDPYNRDDLIKIFNPETFLTSGLTQNQEKRKKNKAGYTAPDSGGRPSRFWIPLLGLLTGARLEELSQLALTDVIAVDREGNTRNLFIPEEQQTPYPALLLEDAQHQGETLCIYIHSGEGQSIKNPGSKRYIPLSDILTRDLGFLGYLSEVHKGCNKGRMHSAPQMFPELTKASAKDSYSNAISNWFRRYRESIGIIKGPDGGRKDFHSFRDTVAHWCDQIGEVNEKPAARYLGHKYKSMTFGTYSKDTAPHILYEAITRPFSEYARSFLDIDGLKTSKWARGEGDHYPQQ